MNIFVISYVLLKIISFSYADSQHTVAGKTVADWLKTCKLNFHQLGEVALSQVLRNDGFCEGIVCVIETIHYGINIQHCQEVQKETKVCIEKFSSFPTCCNEELCLKQNNMTKKYFQYNAVESIKASSNEDSQQSGESDESSASTSEEENKEVSDNTTKTISNTTEESFIVPTEINISLTNNEIVITEQLATEASATEQKATEEFITEEYVTEESIMEQNTTTEESSIISTSDFPLNKVTEVNIEMSTYSIVADEESFNVSSTLEPGTDKNKVVSTTEQNNDEDDDEKNTELKESTDLITQTTLKQNMKTINYDYIIAIQSTTESSKQHFSEQSDYYYDDFSKEVMSKKQKHKPYTKQYFPSMYNSNNIHKSIINNKNRLKIFKKLQKKKTKKNSHYYFGAAETPIMDYERKCKKHMLACLSLYLNFIADDGGSAKKQSKQPIYSKKSSKHSQKKYKLNFKNNNMKHHKVTWSDLYNEESFRILKEEDQIEDRKFHKENPLHNNDSFPSEVNVEEPFSKIPNDVENNNRRSNDLEDPKELNAVEYNFK